MDAIKEIDDIVDLSDQQIRELLKTIEREELVVALKGCSPEATDRLFENITEQAVNKIKEDMNNLGQVELSRVEDCIESILSKANDVII